MKTAVLYARVSSADQAEEEVSIPAQVAAAERYVATLGARIIRVFTDEGRSAFKEANRPTFEAAIDYAAARPVDYFVTWSSSRFARNKVEAALFKRDLERAGVELVYTSMKIDRSTDEGWLIDSFLEVIDEYRSRDTSKDTRRSLLHNAQQGYFVYNLAPFGFAKIPAPDNPKRKKLVPLPEEAVRVREVFEMRKAGLGAKAIAVRFNDQGITYRGRKWNKRSVLDLLRNPAMIGQSIFNKTEPRTNRIRPRGDWIVLQTHEPLIDLELWHLVQATIDEAAESSEARGYSRSTHPFTGLLRCEYCGGTLVVETASGNGGRYSYYICRRGKEDGHCKTTRYPTAAVDQFLTDVIFDRLLDPATIRDMAIELIEACGKWKGDQRARRQGLVAQLKAVQGRNSKLFEVLEMLGKDAPNLGDLTGRLRQNNTEIKALERQIDELDAEPLPAVELADLDLDRLAAEVRSLFTETASIERLRTFYRGFIRGITLRAGTAEIEYEPAQLVSVAGPVHSIEKWGG